MSAAPAISTAYESASKPEVGPEPLSELSKRAVADFDHFVYNYLRTRKIETLRENPEKFERFSEKHFARGERIVHWPRVQPKQREIAKLDPELRNKILVEAIHLGALGPYHPEHDRALLLHAQERQKEISAKPEPVATPE